MAVCALGGDEGGPGKNISRVPADFNFGRLLERFSSYTGVRRRRGSCRPLIFSGGLYAGKFGFGFGKIFLKRIALLHLSHNGLGQYASGVDIRRTMPGDFAAVPADGAGFGNYQFTAPNPATNSTRFYILRQP